MTPADSPASPVILAVNAGSSSLRLALLAGPDLQQLAAAHFDGAAARSCNLGAWLDDAGAGRPDCVVHRVVHGGEQLRETRWLNAAAEAEIARLAPLAPLHNPAALHWIRAVRDSLGAGMPQAASFDTAFFAELPAAAAHYALPAMATTHPLRRYGFHGLAHRWMLERWQTLAGAAPATRRSAPEPGPRVLTLQLGAGSSITASVNGRPVETSMGFTPLEGLVMATRSGDVDPGLLLYLQRDQGLTPAQLEDLLNTRSGLLGVSGIAGDMRTLLASDAPTARLAVDLYCHRLRKYLGAYLAVLGGADAIVFGGGIGEHAPRIRAGCLDTLAFAGILIDPQRNEADGDAERAIHHRDSRAAVWVIPVDEARLMARDTLALLHSPATHDDGSLPC